MLERQMLSDNDVLDFMERVREARGVSRSELETAVGISPGMISRWRHAQSFSKNKEVLYKIFEYLEIEFILRSDVIEEDAELQECVQEEVRKPTKDEYLNGEILRVLNEFLGSASLLEKSLMLNNINTAILLAKQD